MKVIIFGATGMVGQGVVREALLAADVSDVLVIGRTSTGISDRKLREIIRPDFDHLKPGEVAGYDACFFCLGTPSGGKDEEEYTKTTYDLTMRVAETLKSANPDMTFIYVSGEGADSSEKGPVMWARVRGRVENALLKLFPKAYIFRPGAIQSMHGEKSKTKLYRMLYPIFVPLFPLMRALAPNSLTTTEIIGRAMLNIARKGAPVKILRAKEFREVAS